MRFLATAALAASAIMMTGALAQAADTTVTLDGFLGWLRPYLLEAVSLLIGALLLWATKRLHDWTGISIEARHREALQSALTNGAALALAKLPKGGAIDVRSQPVAVAVQYVLESVPDAVGYFGLTPKRVTELLVPKLVSPAS